MSIRKTQIAIKQDEVTQSLLQKGIQPSSFEVTSQLKAHFDSHVPGLPYFHPIKAEAHEPSNPVTYNQMFKNLGLDLDVIYKANLEQTKKILMTEEYYNAEKEIVQTKLDKLQLRLDNLQEILSSGKVAQSFCQVFDNFYNIEFNENAARNIPATTAFVDLVQKRVYNEKNSYSHNKYDISKSSAVLSILDAAGIAETNGDLADIFKDTVNEVFTYIITTDNEKGLKLGLEVTLPEVKDISSIALSLTSSKAVDAILSVSEDGLYYTQLYTVSNPTTLEWNFATMPVKYIRIILNKNEPDGISDSGFQYYFILRNLSASSETFVSQGVYVSKPIEFGDVIDTITLKANDMVFPNTNIYYFLGLDNDQNKIDWQILENGVPYNLGLLNENVKIVNNITPFFGSRLEMGPGADPNLFQLCQIPKDVNINSIQIMPGYQMWYTEGTDITSDTFNLINYDYDSSKVVLKQFLDNEQYIISVKPKRVYTFTQYVYCEEDITIDGKWVKTQDSINSIYLQSFMVVNGNQVKSVAGTYNLRLKKGRNKVILLTYVSPGAGISEINIIHNFNFKEVSFDIFSDPAMKPTSVHALKYNIDAGNRRYFAIQNGFIIVKHDPKWTSISYDCTGIRYLLKYKNFKDDAYKVITVKNGQPCVKFRIMATMQSSAKDISSQLISYRLIGQ